MIKETGMNTGRRGSAAVEAVIGAAIIMFVVFPVFSAVVEKYIIANKAQIIRDAVDLTNIAVYNAVEAGNLGKNEIMICNEELERIYRTILAKNLNLKADLSPERDSVADGTVGIKSLAVFTGGFPLACPDGTAITRPAVHSRLTVPVKPSLYRGIILGMLGKQYIELEVHVDSDIPVDN